MPINVDLKQRKVLYFSLVFHYGGDPVIVTMCA